MRRLSPALVVVMFALLAAAGPAGGERPGSRASLPAGLSVRVPAGWHVLGGWLSDVIDPAPRLAVASFPARLSRRTCACGFPNVIRFPRRGAFIFVWEYLHPSRRQLAGTARRPARSALTPGRGALQTCDGPTDEFSFKQDGRAFQVEVYLGPGTDRDLRARTAATLDSLHVAPET